MAYNPEDVGSKPTAGNIFNLLVLQKQVVKLDVKRSNQP